MGRVGPRQKKSPSPQPSPHPSCASMSVCVPSDRTRSTTSTSLLVATGSRTGNENPSSVLQSFLSVTCSLICHEVTQSSLWCYYSSSGVHFPSSLKVRLPRRCVSDIRLCVGGTNPLSLSDSPCHHSPLPTRHCTASVRPNPCLRTNLCPLS